MFQNDLINPLDYNYYPNKFNSFSFAYFEEVDFFYDMIEYNNNLHKYK